MASNHRRFEREHPEEVKKAAEAAAQRAEAQKKADFWKKNTKWFIAGGIALLVVLLVVLVIVFNQSTADSTTGTETEVTEEAAADIMDVSQVEVPTGTQYIAIDVADYGTITAELYPDIAPITVANFLSLVDSHFYDGLTFHRIISGFMIQGGDPNGDGTGGSEKTIKGEFSANGVENNLLHTRGVLSMARSTDMNSASSQFFIMHADATHLDGNYAAFGKVISGMEVVDAICEKVTAGYNGSVETADQPVITSIRRIDAPAAETSAE